MSDTNNPGDKTLTVAPSKTLHLKRPVEQGMVRQSFSHGRTKAVVVEKVKRRIPGAGEAPPPREAAPTVGLKPASPASAPTKAAPSAPAAPAKTGVVLHTLTEEQREARAKALVGARAREEEDRRRQEADAKARAER
ncbi:MAG TPA: translation initiation factor IF-2 associated domain-containing protein, partial [Roseiarcus sp.]|nr:translation initiation factor IF-2 associated domain-containing protein [Roseiarcus sp.]